MSACLALRVSAAPRIQGITYTKVSLGLKCKPAAFCLVPVTWLHFGSPTTCPPLGRGVAK